MRKILITIISTFFICNANAQEKTNNVYDTLKDIGWCRNRIVELKKQIQNTKVDTIKVDLYEDIGSKYYRFRKDSSLMYFLKMYNLASKINFNRGINISLYQIAETHTILGNYLESIKSSLQLIDFAERNRDTTFWINGLTSVIHSYGEAKEYENALLYAQKLKQLCLQYSNLNEHEFGVALMDMGDAYMNIGKLDSALSYFQKGYEFSLQKQDRQNEFFFMINLGDINHKIGNLQIALAYYKKSILYDDLDRVTKIYILLAMSKTFEKLGLQDSVIYYSKQAYQASKSAEYLKGILNSSENLSKLYKERKMFDSAFTYQNDFIAAKDSIYSEEKTRQLYKLSTAEAIRQNEIEEQKIMQHEERARNLRLGFIAIFIPTLGAFVYILSRRKKKNARVVTLLGITSLLMLFEFISLLIHPLIERITHHDALLMYLILLVIASILVPLHHKLESYVKRKLQ